jgi:Transposase, Mutator family
VRVTAFRPFGLVDQRHQQEAGREPGAVYRALAERTVPVPDLDARYEKVREAGVIASQAVLIAIGIDWDGRPLQELRRIYHRRDLAEARADLAAWIGKWEAKYPRLVAWVPRPRPCSPAWTPVPGCAGRRPQEGRCDLRPALAPVIGRRDVEGMDMARVLWRS